MENGYDLDEWNPVWKRESNEMSAGDPEVERLQRFMNDEARDANTYARMAQRSSDPRRAQTFRHMSADEKNHLRRLQTWYFILTGDTYVPQPSKPEVTSMLGLMRSQYKGELEGAREYAEAAKTTKYERLAEIYADNAGDEASHAKNLERMLEDIMR